MPHDEYMPYNELLHYASAINTFIKWRYSYGRMVNKTRFKKEPLPDIVISSGFEEQRINELIPNDGQSEQLDEDINLKEFSIMDLFTLQHGDFHSLDTLDQGSYPTVSRIESNNGIVGLFEKPDNANVYKPLTISVSTVSGDAFIQLDEYIATDNVVICKPIKPLQPEILFFITMMINREKWRWMYGRQCYKTKFAKTIIALPVNANGEIDEKYIKNFVRMKWGWKAIKKYVFRS